MELYLYFPSLPAWTSQGQLYLLLLVLLLSWEDNIKMDLQEVGRDCGDWMGLAKDRDRWRALVSTVMNFGGVP